MRRFISFIVLSVMVCCDPISQQQEVETLEDAKTKEDTIYVIDNYNYNNNGYLKPSCSCSPDYIKCMKSRIRNIGLDTSIIEK